MDRTPRTALLSVSDKTGIVELARGLHALGIRLLSTGGTARLLADAGLPVTEVSEHTGSPEMLDGRVKTLHPRVHGALLARRDVPAHMAALQAQGIPTIDVLVVNLYPFEQAVAREDCTFEDAIENIDIGGPAMVRSAAKNHADVIVLTDPAQYEGALAALRGGGVEGVPKATRFALAVAAFERIACYDAAIANHLSSLRPDGSREPFPAQVNRCFVKVQDLRYGENPHQRAAFYRELHPAPGSLATAVQRQGKELSFNNIADADAAWECVKGFGRTPACVIVKHANPCGVALGASAAEAYAKAFRTDPSSAFGGIIAFNVPLDGAAAEAVAKQFVEVLVAPAFTPEARSVFAAKANARLLEIAWAPDAAEGAEAAGSAPGAMAATAVMAATDLRRVGSGLLMQSADTREVQPRELSCPTRRKPEPAELDAMLFAWRVAKFVKSNAIVFAGQGAHAGSTLGVGAGQMSRIDSARIAAIKAANAGLSLAGSVVASDAFFPFRDGLDAVADAGATGVIQPGGSVRDEEVIAAADERGLVMVFTGVRHFRH
jgi:phosphoribosylaminoimidazolecarboxamide formyltransferase/IMP cyclohydrolase